MTHSAVAGDQFWKMTEAEQPQDASISRKMTVGESDRGLVTQGRDVSDTPSTAAV